MITGQPVDDEGGAGRGGCKGSAKCGAPPLGSDEEAAAAADDRRGFAYGQAHGLDPLLQLSADGAAAAAGLASGTGSDGRPDRLPGRRPACLAALGLLAVTVSCAATPCAPDPSRLRVVHAGNDVVNFRRRRNSRRNHPRGILRRPPQGRPGLPLAPLPTACPRRKGASPVASTTATYPRGELRARVALSICIFTHFQYQQ